jgi:hypothetical protein
MQFVSNSQYIQFNTFTSEYARHYSTIIKNRVKKKAQEPLLSWDV